MKRMVLLILALLLLTDMPDDGCLGKARLVNSPSPAESLEVSFKHCGSEAPDCHNEILRANLQLPLPQCRSQPTNPVVRQSRKIVFTSHLSSAGGLPG